jgi:hypothetical protein
MTGKERRPVATAARPAMMPPRPVTPPPRPGFLHTLSRAVLYLVLLFFGSLVLYVTYEFGRYNGSYDRLVVSQQRSELDVQIERLQAANRQLRTQLAELDTIRIGHQREQAEVARTIGDLQAQVARESQELAFYRGVMAKAPTELGVRLGEVHIARGKKPNLYVVHVPLLRTGRPDNTVQGTLTLHVDSDQGKVLDLTDLTDGKKKDLPYNFRYYANIDQEITLPDGFKPLHLGVDIRSVEKDAPPLAQTFVWSSSVVP